MTIKQALIRFKNIEPDLLMAKVLRKPKEFIFMNPEFRLTGGQEARLEKMAGRRQKGEPLAYILGYKDFYGMRFKVNSFVLVPRPETEMLVDLLAENFRRLKSEKNKIFKILDVGTGSGCLAVSIAKKLAAKVKTVEIAASDISPEALAVARQNARIHRVKIEFIQSNLLENISFVPDVLAANLPYGWREWKNNSSAETAGLKFEPPEALFTEEKGLYAIRRLLEQIAAGKEFPKIIFLEFDPRQKTELAKKIKKILPGSKAEFYKDYSGFWRAVKIIPK